MSLCLKYSLIFVLANSNTPHLDETPGEVTVGGGELEEYEESGAFVSNGADEFAPELQEKVLLRRYAPLEVKHLISLPETLECVTSYCGLRTPLLDHAGVPTAESVRIAHPSHQSRPHPLLCHIPIADRAPLSWVKSSPLTWTMPAL